MWERAVALAQQDGRRETAAIYEAAQAVCEAHFGNAAAAQDSGPDPHWILQKAAMWSMPRRLRWRSPAILPDRNASLRIWQKRFPEDTPVQFEYLPTLRALSATFRKGAAGRDRATWKRRFPTTWRCRARRSSPSSEGCIPPMCADRRTLQAGRGREAAAEFQKILDHRGIVLADPVGALAHLQLGRAYVVSGDRTRAKSAYQDFLTLWKDADPDIPILKQARAEYAKLQ